MNYFSSRASDIMTKRQSHQQCELRRYINPSGLVEPLISHIL